MGGLTIVPDCRVGDVAVSETSVLLLPGANTWNDPRHGAVLEKSGRTAPCRRRGVCNLRGHRRAGRTGAAGWPCAYQQRGGIS